MGLGENFKFSCTFLFLFLLINTIFFPSPASSSSSSHEIQLKAPPSSKYQAVFYIKNTNALVLNKQDYPITKNRRKMIMRRSSQNMIENVKTRPFEVMLPKGYVPPSGSSPCHNEYPDSAAIYCDLSASNP
ncbi:hypothetical protein I3760_10G091100 [Carya illinoinensis]|nr:hypothetical protein I3760_10G091100 [Carya illinoinensis]